jgi:DNA-binding response OmpR family regulator
VLADLLLPDGKGTDLLERRAERPTLPLVVLTSHGDEGIAVDAIKAGALDYVVKSVDCFERMPHIARRAIREWQHMLERERAELELRQTEERLVEAQRVAHIGSWEWSAHDGLWYSDEARRIGGIAAAAELALDALFARVLAADRPAVESAVQAMMQEGTPLSLSLRAAAPEGALRVFQLTGQACAQPTQQASDDRPNARVVGTIQDITEKKRSELQSLQAQKLEAIGHLASGIAHDFNNLLMGIRGCLTLAFKHVGGQHPARRSLDDALLATQDGATAIRQALLQKPFNEAELLASVHQTLTHSDQKECSLDQGSEARAILLVEDSDTTRRVTRELLQDLGYDVLDAASAAEARACFHEHRERIAVLLTDLGLPDMNGRELVQELRALNEDLTVVFASGKPVEASELTTALARANTYFLEKPIEFDELEELIGAVMARHPSLARAL